MAFIQIALVGGSTEPVLVAVRELGAEKVILVGSEDHREAAAEIERVLQPLGVETTWRPVRTAMLLGAMHEVQAIADEHKARRGDLVVNVGPADKGDACAGLSAAFVAGIPAVDVMEGQVVYLPVLHFSYEEVVSKVKLAILQGLDHLGGSAKQLRAVAEASGQQDSLVSYHIRGGRDAKGLVDLGLVELDRADPGLTIRLTPMGTLLARGMRA